MTNYEILGISLPPELEFSSEELLEIDSRMVEIERARQQDKKSVRLKLSSGKEVEIAIYPVRGTAEKR